MSSRTLATAIKGWLAGCVVASAVFFAVGLKRQFDVPGGPSPDLVLLCIFAWMIEFLVIAIFTAAPAALFIWSADKFRIQHPAWFAGFGALLGLLAQVLFNPRGHREVLSLFVV